MTRTRTRQMGDATASVGFDEQMELHAATLHRLKVAKDRADAAYEEAKAAAHLTLKGNAAANPGAPMEYVSPSRGERPAITIKEATRATNIVDIKGYAKAVEPKVFLETVSITLTEAKKHVTGNVLDKITKTTQSAPFLDVRFSAKKGS